LAGPLIVMALVSVTPEAAGQQSEASTKFAKHWAEAEKAAAERDCKAAAAGYAAAAEFIPYEPSVRYRLGCCLARLGEPDHALAALDEAAERVDAAVDEAARRSKVDRGRVVLAGFSQGGGVALRLVADRPDRFRGAVAVNSLCQPLDKASWQKAAGGHGVRVCVICGEYDKLLGRSKSAAEVLKAAKVPSRFDTVEKCGHEYPPDASDRLQAAARFVLTGERSDK
jgi:predicted esterase